MDYQQLHTDIIADGGYLGTALATCVRMRAYSRSVDVHLMSRMAFMLRFTSAERIAIRGSSDPVVADLFFLLNSASEIDVRMPEVTGGLDYMAEVMDPPLLASDRPAIIAAPDSEVTFPYRGLEPRHVLRAQNDGV